MISTYHFDPCDYLHHIPTPQPILELSSREAPSPPYLRTSNRTAANAPRTQESL